MTDCAACADRPLIGLSRFNAEALAAWQTLDVYGRELDAFGGCPMPLRLEAVNQECGRSADPDGIRWRVLMLEEILYAQRIDRHKAKQDKK